jgi:hypothetical protein
MNRLLLFAHRGTLSGTIVFPRGVDALSVREN